MKKIIICVLVVVLVGVGIYVSVKKDAPKIEETSQSVRIRFSDLEVVAPDNTNQTFTLRRGGDIDIQVKVTPETKIYIADQKEIIKSWEVFIAGINESKTSGFMSGAEIYTVEGLQTGSTLTAQKIYWEIQ